MIALGRPVRPVPTPSTSTVSLHKPKRRSDLRMIGRDKQEISLALCRLGAHMAGAPCPQHASRFYARHGALHKAGA